MASSEVDRKFLGKLAKNVEGDNQLLASVLFRLLGLSVSLSAQLIQARKQRRPDVMQDSSSLQLYFHIIWLSREGLVLLEQYVIPMVGDHIELKVLSLKLRASFYHIIVLFHNTPPVSVMVEGQTPTTPGSGFTPSRPDKGKGVARDDDYGDDEGGVGHDMEDYHTDATRLSSKQPAHNPGGGTLGPPPGFGPEVATAFLLKPGDYLPLAHECFRQASRLADELLWGSHSLRVSVKTEYAAFLYDCMHDREGSRRIAKQTIGEVYDAQEGIDNDMFTDACELVTVLGRMMRRGLGQAKGGAQQQTQQRQNQQQQHQVGDLSREGGMQPSGATSSGILPPGVRATPDSVPPGMI